MGLRPLQWIYHLGQGALGREQAVPFQTGTFRKGAGCPLPDTHHPPLHPISSCSSPGGCMVGIVNGVSLSKHDVTPRL